MWPIILMKAVYRKESYFSTSKFGARKSILHTNNKSHRILKLYSIKKCETLNFQSIVIFNRNIYNYLYIWLYYKVHLQHKAMTICYVIVILCFCVFECGIFIHIYYSDHIQRSHAIYLHYHNVTSFSKNEWRSESAFPYIDSTSSYGSVKKSWWMVICNNTSAFCGKSF